jgi:hypothetical protein
MSLPLYPWEKSPQYPLDRRLSGPLSQSGQQGEVKILDTTGTRTPTPSDVRLTSWKVALYKLHFMCTKHVFQGYSGNKKAKHTHNRYTFVEKNIKEVG